MAITLNGTTGITTPTYGGSVPSEYITPVTGFKNRIINGAMVIDQRNAGASVTLSTTTQYPVDSFPSYKGTAGATITAQQRSTTNIAHPAGFNNSILYTVSTGATPAAGDINAFWQMIEGFNAADLKWGTSDAQTVTLSFWVRSSVTGTYSISLANGAANRLYVATYLVNSANTWEQKSITIAGDTSGTWAIDNSNHVQVTWDIGYGTNFNGTAGAWGSSTIRRTSGSVQLAATTGATFYITGVQLEVGDTATSFDYKPYSQELALTAPSYTARAWVNFNGSGTVAIRDSANVSSITDSGVGKWIINFATAMTDANYTVVGTQNFNQSGADNHTNVVAHIRRVATPLTTTQAYVATSYNQNAHDATMACFVVFR